MIFVRLSVWMRPSAARAWPRTVIMVGRPARSVANFSAKAARSAGPSSSAMKSAKAGPNRKSPTGKLPALSIGGKSRARAARAGPRTKPGTIRWGNGSETSGVCRRPSISRAWPPVTTAACADVTPLPLYLFRPCHKSPRRETMSRPLSGTGQWRIPRHVNSTLTELVAIWPKQGRHETAGNGETSEPDPAAFGCPRGFERLARPGELREFPIPDGRSRPGGCRQHAAAAAAQANAAGDNLALSRPGLRTRRVFLFRPAESGDARPPLRNQEP